MAIVHNYNPDQVYFLNAGTPYDFSIEYNGYDDSSSFFEAYTFSLAFVTAPNSETLLPADATLLPGMTINGASSQFSIPLGTGNPITLGFHGTPTTQGTYTFYLLGKTKYVVTDGDPTQTSSQWKTVTVIVSGAPLSSSFNNNDPIKTSTAGNPTIGTPFVSAPINISNGSGSYSISISGAWTGSSGGVTKVGLSDTASVPGTLNRTLNTSSNVFYVVSPMDSSMTAGTNNLTISILDTVTNTTITATGPFTIEAATGGLTISQSPAFPASLTCLSEGSWTFSPSGGVGPYTWSYTGTLPGGSSPIVPGTTGGGATLIQAPGSNDYVLTLNKPTNEGVYNITLSVTDSNSISAVKAYALVIEQAEDIVGTLPSGTVASNYSGSVVLIGSRPYLGLHTYSWSISAGSLPPGLTIQGTGKTGTIVGTPTAAGTYNFQVTCSYASIADPNLTGSQIADYSIVVAPGSSGALTIAVPTIPTFSQHIAIDPITLTASGSGMTNPLTWSIASGTLPTGLVFNQVGNTYVLSGTPTTYTPNTPPTISVQVTDSSGTPKVGGINITLTVNPNILVVGTFPSGARGTPYDNKVTLLGGDGSPTQVTIQTETGFPTGLTLIALQEAGSNKLQLSGTPSTPGNPFTGSVTVRTVLTNRSNQVYTQQLTFNIVITGDAITVTPRNTSLCIGNTSGASAIIEVTVAGGSTNQFDLGTTGVGSTISPAGPYNSGQKNIIWSNSTPGTYTVTASSTENPSITATITITVDTNTRSVSISPSTVPALYGGQTAALVATLSGGTSCSQVKGWWEFATTPVGSISPSIYSNAITYIAPAVINTTQTVVLNYRTYENGKNASIYITLQQGPQSNLVITTASPLADGTVGSSYSPVTLTYSGVTGTPSWTVSGALPGGLSLNPVSGVISGTPTASGAYNFTINLSVTPSGGGSTVSTSKPFTLTINGGPSVTITSLTPATGPTGGGTAVTIAGTGFTAGDTVIIMSNDISSGGTPPFEIVTPTPGFSSTSMVITTPAWSSTDPLGYICNVGIVRGGVTIVWKNTAWTWANPGGGLTISNFTPPSVLAGQATNQTIVINGTGFDSGCIVQYKPAAASVYNDLTTSFTSSSQITAVLPTTYFTADKAGTTGSFKVRRPSDSASATAPFLFRIEQVPLIITKNSLVNGTRSVAYSDMLTAVGGIEPYTWSLSGGITLPTGLSLDGPSGSIFGTVDANAQTATPTFKVTDSVGATATKALTILVDGGGLSITTTTLPDARKGNSYNFALLGTGGTSPYTFDIVGGGLPTGLSLSSSGTISGTVPIDPLIVANTAYTFTVRITDNASVTATKILSLNLLEAFSVVTVDSIIPSIGPVAGGTAVTIVGTGFINGCTVKFGNSSGSGVIYVSGTTLTCVTPPSTQGPVSVTVTNPDLGAGTKTNGFTYNLATAPVIVSLNKQDGPFEGGQTVILYGSNFDTVSRVRLGLQDTDADAFNALIKSRNVTTSPQTLVIETPSYTLTDRSARVDVNIYVKNDQGTGTLMAGETGYTYRPAPIITQVLPSSGSTQGGNTIYIIGKNFFERGSRKPRVFIGNVEISPKDIVLKEE